LQKSGIEVSVPGPLIVAAISMPSPARRCVLLAVVAFATTVPPFAIPGSSQSGTGTASRQYAPAYYHGTQLEPPQLMVFPPAGGQVVIPLPVPSLLRFSTFAPDGRAIFATINTITSPRTAGRPARLGPPRLIRVDLGPIRVTKVADLAGLDDVFGLVITPRADRIVFTGAGWKGNLGCDLFEIEPSGGDFRMLLPNFGCAVGGVSPEGSKMLVPRGDGLAVIDLATGVTVQLGTGLWKGAWSPDGRWIAVLQLDPRSEQPGPRCSRTIRIDAHDFSQRRDMGGRADTEVMWSPDSRYLLYSEWQPPCSHGDDPTVLTMDIESGKRAIVKESKCNVNGSLRIGWVSLDAVTEGTSGNPGEQR
jgi:hypothetical protein